MIIVKKRGCSRFFAKNGNQLFNPSPGTIIDHTVTHQNWFDFYLISQCTRQGTAAPTHFNVIWGEVNGRFRGMRERTILLDRTTFKVDHIQRLTFKLYVEILSFRFSIYLFLLGAISTTIGP